MDNIIKSPIQKRQSNKIGIIIGIIVSVLALIFSFVTHLYGTIFAFYPLYFLLEIFDIDNIRMESKGGINIFLFITLGVVFYICLGYLLNRLFNFLKNKSYPKIFSLSLIYSVVLSSIFFLITTYNYQAFKFRGDDLKEISIVMVIIGVVMFLIISLFASILKYFSNK